MYTLFEEFLILAIHEDKGTFIKSVGDRLKPGLSGAILAELALRGKIQASDNHRLQLIDDNPTQEEILNEALGHLKGSERERKFGYWINILGQKIEKLPRRISDCLVQMGILMQEEDHLQWMVPSPLQAEVKASTKYWTVRRLRGVALAQEEAQRQDIVLLSLLRACDLLDLVFLRDECKLADHTINECLFGLALKDPSLQAIQEIEVALADIVEDD